MSLLSKMSIGLLPREKNKLVVYSGCSAAPVRGGKSILIQSWVYWRITGKSSSNQNIHRHWILAFQAVRKQMLPSAVWKYEWLVSKLFVQIPYWRSNSCYQEQKPKNSLWRTGRSKYIKRISTFCLTTSPRSTSTESQDPHGYRKSIIGTILTLEATFLTHNKPGWF